MKYRVMEAKVLLVLAIKGQEKGGLAKKVLEEHLSMGFLGWGRRSGRYARSWDFLLP